MCHETNEKKKKGGEKMTPAIAEPNNISLSDFIKQNSKKIHAVTPTNPSISKDDEWRNEDYWDNLCEEKGDSSQK